jgi:hypothetical protein
VSQGMPISADMTSNSSILADAPSSAIPSRSVGTLPESHVTAINVLREQHTDQGGRKTA